MKKIFTIVAAALLFACAANAQTYANLGYDLGITDLSKSDNILRKQNMLTFTLGYIF